MDGNGLLGKGRPPNPAQMRYIRPDLPDGLSLLETVKEVKPTIIIGLTGCAGLFTEDVIRVRSPPLLLPLSHL